MLAVGEVLAGANGRVGGGQLGVGRGGGFVRPVRLGEAVRQEQAAGTRLVVIVGFVEVQLDLRRGAPVASGPAEPIGAALSVRGRVRGQTGLQ